MILAFFENKVFISDNSAFKNQRLVNKNQLEHSGWNGWKVENWLELRVKVGEKFAIEIWKFEEDITKNTKMSSEFNCDFDAPMFVDFENLDQEGNPDDFFGKLLKKNSKLFF